MHVVKLMKEAAMLRENSPALQALDAEAYRPNEPISAEQKKKRVINDTAWTDERVESLKRLWADGLSASQIAEELGGITRNAVIGKAHRIGLSGRPKKPASPWSGTRPRKTPSSGHRMRGGKARVRGNTASAYNYYFEPESELIEIPVEQRKSLLELTQNTCRWPFGHPGSGEFFFCGGASATDLPYCVHHSRIAHQAAENPRHNYRPYRS